MAVVGMRYPVAAVILTENEGSAISYDTGFVIAKAIRANITYNRNDNPLYADDAIAENDNGLTGYEIELEVDKLPDEVRAKLLGDLKYVSQTEVGLEGEYEQTDASAPYVGFGYMRVLREDGATKYQAVWCHKCQFSEPSEETNTKGETVEWGTPTLNARGMGVRNDNTLTIKYRIRAVFSTATEAVAWLNTKAHIS